MLDLNDTAMKKVLLFLLSGLTVSLATNCVDTIDIDPYITDESSFEQLSHEMIELGDKLDDPYSVENVTKAIASLYPTKAGRVDLKPTDIYARFLPAGEEEMERLLDMGVEFLDHPMDYTIIRDGDYYHDPEVDQEEITWQYCVLPNDFQFPKDIKYEILDYCYISENDPSTRAGGDIDWDRVEEEAFRLTGNADLYIPPTKGQKAKPAGRITIVDEDANGGKPFGLPGVKVVCNSFVKIATCYTDRDGYYQMSKNYSSRPRYRLLFKNKAGFAIGFNLVLIPASMSTLGKGPSTGLDVEINKDSDKKLFQRSVISAAAYEYITKCEEMGIKAPPKSLRIWIFRKLSASSAVMLKHGTLIDNTIIGKYLGVFAALVKSFLPDITLGTKDDVTFADIYSETCHELAHASHFAKVGLKYWDNYAKYVLVSFVTKGFEAYGDGTGSHAGHCEVGEMWAYYMQNKMYHQRYGGAMPVAGSNFWFHPQIFTYLDERGLDQSKIFGALGEDVTDITSLRKRLLSLYPEQSDVINQVFERYAQ